MILRRQLVVFLASFGYLLMIVSGSKQMRFYEEPSDAYLAKNQPAILRCKIENARAGFFRCNDNSSPESATSRIIQIGNKQILTIDQVVTRAQIEEFNKKQNSKSSTSRSTTIFDDQQQQQQSAVMDEISDEENPTGVSYWCVCQGWQHSSDETIISRRAHVKLAYINHNFEWEPMPTTGLIGKSAEIRCLAPDGEPKPQIHWLKNSMPIDKSHQKRYIVSHDGSLLINDVRASDAANYTCVAENVAGKRFSEPAMFTVSANRGWSEWSNWTSCELLADQSSTDLTSSSSECGEGVQKRTRICLNPPTLNNALGCDGFPVQSVSCYIPCEKAAVGNNNSSSLRGHENKALLSKNILEKLIPGIKKSSLNSKMGNNKSSVPLGPPQPSSSLAEYSHLEYYWSQWSSWSMVCDSECRRSRRRECRPAYVSSSGQVVPITDDRLDPMLSLNRCQGSDIDYSNCTFYCEKMATTDSQWSKPRKEFPYKIILASIGILIIIILILIAIVLLKRYVVNRSRNNRHPTHIKTKKPKKRIDTSSDTSPSNEHLPIYYSVQPDNSTTNSYYNTASPVGDHPTAMIYNNPADLTTALLSPHLPHQVNFQSYYGNHQPAPPPILLVNSTGGTNCKEFIKNKVCSTLKCGRAANASTDKNNITENSHMSTASSDTGSSNSTTSSKVKLHNNHIHPGAISPYSPLISQKSNNHHITQSHNSNYYLADCACSSCCGQTSKGTGGYFAPPASTQQTSVDHVVNLINEQRKSRMIYSAVRMVKSVEFNEMMMLMNSNSNSGVEAESYVFNLFKSGGVVEVPKYAIQALIPDELFAQELNVGVFKSQNENLFPLSDQQTILSPIVCVKSEHTMTDYSKPVILSVDHSAQYVDTDWDTFVYYKNPSASFFQLIDPKSDTSTYCQTVANKCFFMLEKDGMYFLGGKARQHTAIKQMRYAIVLMESSIKLYLSQATRASTETLTEHIQKQAAGRVIKMPEAFDLPCNTGNIVSFLDLSVRVQQNNTISQSDSTTRQISLEEIWTTTADFVEIEIPVNMNGSSKSTSSSSLFDIRVNLELDQKLLFSYSNINANASQMHSTQCSHLSNNNNNNNEFYSSVSVLPVFIPLKVTNLLDEYVIRCFKMSTIKKNDWRLFTDLLKCDKDVQYFSSRENSFELIMSLWLVISMSKSASTADQQST